jgi:predicted dehydrogenase
LRAGIIGAGYWGSKVAREYIALMKEKMLESVYICDVDNQRLKPFVDECKTVNDINKVLKEVDMIHVCTPNSTHYEITRKALERHINVLVEKPMAADVNQAFDLVELSMKKGAILQVGHIFRFANIVRKVKQFFELGDFGKHYYFNLEWTHLIPPIENVDVTYDLLPHPLDIINFITGKWPLSFNGIGKTFRRPKLAEAAFIEAIYDEFFANIHLSWLCPVRTRKLEIIGSKKSINADCVKQTAIIYEGCSSRDLIVDQNNTIRDEISNFLGSIKTGKSDFNSSIVGARTIEMICEAMKNIKVLDNK